MTAFADAHGAIDVALLEHYKTGDYGPLGMVLQDHAAAVLAALRLASIQAETMKLAGFHRGHIIHGDAE